jgi:aminopeptidase N
VILRTRLVPVLLAPVLGLVLAGSSLAGWSLAGAPAVAHHGPTPGARGMGDPYFPKDGNGGIDVLHYDVRDSYRFGTGRLSGRTMLDVRATQDLSRFDLDFLLPVRSVTVNGRRATFEHAGDHELRIKPAAPLAKGTRFRVSVQYAGRPAAETSHGERNWLANDTEVVAMNEPHMATWWFPANDHPRDKASFDIRITVPRGKDVIANGVPVGTRKRHGRATTHWRAVEPMASYLAFFAAGSFETRFTTCNGIPNDVAVTRQRPAFARADTARDTPQDTAKDVGEQTCTIVTALANVLGPYPFSAMGGLVTSLPVGFALENQTRPTYPVLAGPNVGLLAHELAHQWFGDSVSVANWRDIWLNEGFAQFCQTYYVTEVVEGHSMQDWLLDNYDSFAGQAGFWKLSIDDPGVPRLFDGAVYTRGSMAVQALRHRIGDPAFWTLLRTWVAQHAYGNGSVADFEALATSISGQDLTAFFDAWLHARVVPAKTADNGLA